MHYNNDDYQQQQNPVFENWLKGATVYFAFWKHDAEVSLVCTKAVGLRLLLLPMQKMPIGRRPADRRVYHTVISSVIIGSHGLSEYSSFAFEATSPAATELLDLQSSD